VRVSPNHIVFAGGSPTAPGAIARFDLATQQVEVLRRSSELQIDPGYLSVPEVIEFPTEQGLTAYGIYYAPKNKDFTAPAGGDRLCIDGGSAGGYTTLAALTFRQVFKAGASYYGVSDLAALAEDTHKFESRYLDGLIGPYPERADLYQARSPIHYVDRLS
jgi:dipeptidyl aminopeptidase/acylaminoacyl peptidase